MESNKDSLVDHTILRAPKPTATSTVERKNNTKKLSNNEDSVSILSINGLSPISENTRCEVNASYNLQEQRSLAENSLLRVNSIPSKYLKPNYSNPTRYLDNFSDSSTVNESDLLKAPSDSSTPRSSIGRTSLSQSVAQLSHKIRNTDITLDNFVEEFQKAMKMENEVQAESIMFVPAEEAASMLLADERSWRRKNELPVNENGFSLADLSSKTSIGDFFRQKSDTLSVFGSASPPSTHVPTPLIDPAEINKSEFESKEDIKKNKSLSISAIQKYLQSEDTPRKAADFLLKKSNEQNFSRYLLDNKSDKNSPSFSKNSSYTSDPSDNELKAIFDKENIDTLNTSNKNRVSLSASPTSRSSSRALTSLPEGKLPIESTATELIWGCIRNDKCVTQEFSIRNKSAKRLGLQMSVTGHDYKLRKDNRPDADLLSSTKVIMHPYESKVIVVAFIPTKIGACVDLLSFSALDSKLQQTRKQSVKLFGYGGNEKIEFSNLIKDTTGKFWMSFGKLDNHAELQQTFSVANKGVLPSFVYIVAHSKTSSQLIVEPTFFTLLPNEHKQITVRNLLTVSSYKIFQKSLNMSAVFELGSLKIVTGTEANRGRLRRICKSLTDSGSTLDSLSHALKQNVKGEAIPNDVNKFRESSSSLNSVLELFNKYEVVLTVENDPDQTILMQCPDESGMYHTLCEDTTISGLETTVSLTSSCRLEPSTIILMPPSKVKDSLFLISESNRELQYQVRCEPEDLEISPQCGIIKPREEIFIYVKYPNVFANSKIYKISVTVGSEVCQAVIKIKSDLI